MNHSTAPFGGPVRYSSRRRSHKSLRRYNPCTERLGHSSHLQSCHDQHR
ncbi:Uncharacterised protein [Vibrio cholerae]|nr:Uncharacterised protein [Vibrio cholerae]